MLGILGDKVPPALKSGALELERGVSSGKQDYETDEKQWPVNKPTIKVEARAQTSGNFSSLIWSSKVLIHFRQVKRSTLMTFHLGEMNYMERLFFPMLEIAYWIVWMHLTHW